MSEKTFDSWWISVCGCLVYWRVSDGWSNFSRHLWVPQRLAGHVTAVVTSWSLWIQQVPVMVMWYNVGCCAVAVMVTVTSLSQCCCCDFEWTRLTVALSDHLFTSFAQQLWICPLGNPVSQDGSWWSLGWEFFADSGNVRKECKNH